MIGQKNLLKIIDEQILMEEFPRFSIIVGAEGSGKKTLALYIGEMLQNYQTYIVPDVKVETIRNMIADSYKVNTPTVYMIFDADTMSANSKNAMLKVTEEPPNDAIFIMTISDSNMILDTLRSRASIYYMQPYTPEEIIEYADCDIPDNILIDLCETPGDVNKLSKYGIELFEFTEKVVNNIATVSSANALKIADSIAFKDGADGYDLELFLRAFKSVCGRELKKCVAENDIEGQMWYSIGIKIVTNSLSQLKITGINKGALFDIFILDIRKEWA